MPAQRGTRPQNNFCKWGLGSKKNSRAFWVLNVCWLVRKFGFGTCNLCLQGYIRTDILPQWTISLKSKLFLTEEVKFAKSVVNDCVLKNIAGNLRVSPLSISQVAFSWPDNYFGNIMHSMYTMYHMSVWKTPVKASKGTKPTIKKLSLTYPHENSPLWISNSFKHLHSVVVISEFYYGTMF